nr:unnamed protein product [Callosobruchus analis]
MGILDIPPMASRTFQKETYKLNKIWKEYLEEDMEENGKQEKQVAIEKGHIMLDGTPYIIVIVDGGWSKRTYGHGYNAVSGVVSLASAETKKPLFLGVRNKVCSFCLFYQKKVLLQNTTFVSKTSAVHLLPWNKT